MTDKSTELILNNLNAIALKLGMATQTLWPYLIRQQYLDALFSFVFLFFTGLALCFPAYLFFKHRRSKVKSVFMEEDLDGPEFFLALIGGFLLIVFIISFCVFLHDLNSALNPNLGAVKSLIDLIKSK